MKRARLSCPWCPWVGEANAETIEAVTELGRSMVEQHNAKAGHEVIKGRKPRTGYYKGRPIS